MTTLPAMPELTALEVPELTAVALTAAPELTVVPELTAVVPAARMPALPWGRDKTMLWGAHLAVLAPLLFVFKTNPGAIALIAGAMIAYHTYRLLAVHRCAQPGGAISLFHAVFIAPLLLMTRGSPTVVALIAWLLAATFAANFALDAWCTELRRRGRG